MVNAVASNIVWHEANITKADRHHVNQHKGGILWLTGLSGSGKSTLANAVEKKLFEMGVRSYVLDGDNIRHGLNKDLGFSAIDRKENIRRIGEVAKLFVDAGFIVITAFISPYQQDRQLAREMVETIDFNEVYVKCPLNECEKRDPKGLYQKARKGEITQFTGISAPYEEPNQPELLIETDKNTIDSSVDQIIHYLKKNGIIN